MDRTLFNFSGLQATGVADANGDIAFDQEPCATEPSNVIKLHTFDRDDD